MAREKGRKLRMVFYVGVSLRTCSARTYVVGAQEVYFPALRTDRRQSADRQLL